MSRMGDIPTRRGASITAMSTIQGNPAESIEKLQNDFGKDVTFCVVDLRVPNSQPINTSA